MSNESVIRVKMSDGKSIILDELIEWMYSFDDIYMDVAAKRIRNEYLVTKYDHDSSCSYKTCKGECYERKQ